MTKGRLAGSEDVAAEGRKWLHKGLLEGFILRAGGEALRRQHGLAGLFRNQPCPANGGIAEP